LSSAGGSGITGCTARPVTGRTGWLISVVTVLTRYERQSYAKCDVRHIGGVLWRAAQSPHALQL